MPLQTKANAHAKALDGAHGHAPSRGRALWPAIHSRPRRCRTSGGAEGRQLTWQGIADTLAAEGRPTGQGGQWSPSVCRLVWLRAQEAEAEGVA